jgi:UDP-N-acetylmuramate--alanine ligase
MNLIGINKIYFLGIGGIGMSALARYFLWIGKKVAGYDKSRSDITKQLEKEGAVIHYKDNPELIPDDLDLIIYTPAIPKTDQEYLYLKSSGVPMLKRAEVLGMISREVNTIAVAGTHGKTTITTMIAHIFKASGVEISAFMGGISQNYNSNFLVSSSPKWMVVEADEYDRSFLHLNPLIGVISSMDADHLDVYGNLQNLEESFKLFIKEIHKKGALVSHVGLDQLAGLHPNLYTYGFDPGADFFADKVRIEFGQMVWELKGESGMDEYTLGVPGMHNLENAIAAAGVAMLAGIDVRDIKKALRNYKGVKRRFDIRVKNDNVIFIDDYAHHPKEIKACISSVKDMFPGKRVTGIFQPHLFSRTRDFADEFAESLNILDEVAIMDIYPARELPIEGVNATFLLNKISVDNKLYVPDSELLNYVSKNDFEVLVTMGAGSIDQYVEPIRILLERC